MIGKYTRHKGDDLLSKDNRLKYKWMKTEYKKIKEKLKCN